MTVPLCRRRRSGRPRAERVLSARRCTIKRVGGAGWPMRSNGAAEISTFPSCRAVERMSRPRHRGYEHWSTSQVSENRWAIADSRGIQK